jgi:hypothetical protein
MPRIMTTCSVTGAAAPTGRRTPEIKLESLIGARAFRWPSRHGIYEWTSAQASVEGRLGLAAI